MSILNLDNNISREILVNNGWTYWRSHKSFKKSIRWQYGRWKFYHEFYLVNGVGGWYITCYAREETMHVDDYTDVEIYIQSIQSHFNSHCDSLRKNP